MKRNVIISLKSAELLKSLVFNPRDKWDDKTTVAVAQLITGIQKAQPKEGEQKSAKVKILVRPKEGNSCSLIQVVKEIRSLFNTGMKEAKDIVDSNLSIEVDRNSLPSLRTRCSPSFEIVEV